MEVVLGKVVIVWWKGVNCVGKGFGASGVDNRGIGVMSSGGNVTVAGGGARWRDC